VTLGDVASQDFEHYLDVFYFRWTGFYITNPEYGPDDMLKASLHALASSKSTNTSLLVLLILPGWDDTPWNSTAIRVQENMTTLMHLLAGHVHFVPTHQPTDDNTSNLSPAK
jgi:hypothetical protein